MIPHINFEVIKILCVRFYASNLGILKSWYGIHSFSRLPWWQGGKESAYQCRRHKGCGFDPWVGKILWRRKWQPAPVVFPVKFRGQRSLVGYSPWGSKELDMTKQTHIYNMAYPFLSIRIKYAIYK